MGITILLAPESVQAEVQQLNEFSMGTHLLIVQHFTGCDTTNMQETGYSEVSKSP